MALITCPECGQQVSSLAGKCPHCGSPINIATICESDAPKTTRIKKRMWPVWKWIVAVAGGIFCLIGLFFTITCVWVLAGGYNEIETSIIGQRDNFKNSEEKKVTEAWNFLLNSGTLKSPASARMVSYTITEKGDVVFTLDSQNGFGAMLRGRCMVMYSNGRPYIATGL